MPNLVESIKRLFIPVSPLPAGMYHFQAPPDSAKPYRLHLRLEPDGTGLLIINASTILHLNQTAAEYAYHLVKQTPDDQLTREIADRYRVNKQHAFYDFKSLKDRIEVLIESSDLDPETYLDFERTSPHSAQLSAPLRLDCALTYRLNSNMTESITPLKRVDRELTTNEWFKIFDKAWSYGIPHIILTGGEPTLRDDLSSLIEHTEANGQVVGLLSDGLKLVDQGYLQTLLQTGLDHLMFLLDPENPDSWEALETCLAADLSVVVHLTLTLLNVMNVSQYINRMLMIGVKTISLSASDPALHDSLIHHRNEAAALDLSLVWDLPVPYSSYNPITLETQIDNSVSGEGHSWLYIEPDGDVLPAQGINQVLGNALNDSWDKFWT